MNTNLDHQKTIRRIAYRIFKIFGLIIAFPFIAICLISAQFADEAFVLLNYLLDNDN
jgi:nitrogen fixation/metabolism regulation signal transduction histidine kinase